MTDIQRLDYSKPPPGYTVCFEDSSGANGDGPPLWWYGAPHYLASMGSEAEALAAAWAYHKAHNDPPWLRVSYVLTVGWIVMVEEPKRLHIHTEVSAASARTAAWAWHDRRLTLAAKLDVALIVDDEPFKGQTIRTVVSAGEARHFDGEQRPYAAWPCILTWSDEQVSSAERWLLDSTAEMPEVLRG